MDGQVGSAAHFNQWLANSAQQSDVAKYQQYLAQQLGVAAVPPMHELLTTARSWLVCGFAPYQVPPETLWSSMLPTLRLYHALKTQAVLPAHTQIRSVYRNPALNECAGGAPSSKHMANSAIDVWIPDYAPDDPRLAATQDALCQFWLVHGERWNLGLGLYATGAIHLDTQGYRKWGAQHSLGGAACQQMFAGQ
ncbi:hypothetical protein B0181_07505 [Moraxella caviae]|uniref:Peptidase M15A C-terminal domain-containing protein n=1 Tax=Moraxella caviae TaxID=34060 RepID=A0A1S9ZZS1_9GAMM|nr:hypothetical protein B0181_07505 [Moraxella caviae]